MAHNGEPTVGNGGLINGAAGLQRSNSVTFSRRPSSAHAARGTNSGQGSEDEEEDTRPTLRVPKPPLLRSQSEYASPHRQPEEEREQSDSGGDFEWGARHGFEDHYQSEDIISQLANVSMLFFRILGVLVSFGSSKAGWTSGVHRFVRENVTWYKCAGVRSVLPQSC